MKLRFKKILGFNVPYSKETLDYISSIKWNMFIKDVKKEIVHNKDNINVKVVGYSEISWFTSNSLILVPITLLIRFYIGFGNFLNKVFLIFFFILLFLVLTEFVLKF